MNDNSGTKTVDCQPHYSSGCRPCGRFPKQWVCHSMNQKLRKSHRSEPFRLQAERASFGRSSPGQRKGFELAKYLPVSFSEGFSLSRAPVLGNEMCLCQVALSCGKCVNDSLRPEQDQERAKHQRNLLTVSPHWIAIHDGILDVAYDIVPRQTRLPNGAEGGIRTRKSRASKARRCTNFHCHLGESRSASTKLRQPGYVWWRG